MTGQFTAEIAQLHGGRILHFRLRDGDLNLCWSDVVIRWNNDQHFREFFVSLLADAPFPAYFLETPPVTSTTFDNEFEFVLVDSPQLAGIRTEQQAFSNQFEKASADESVIEFANLGGDATLIVPCLRGPQSAYAQISAFARHAPVDQQHELWKLLGTTLERKLGSHPVWISTSGLGVYWVHIRFDVTPKYYTYEPYRRF
jgi:hypothetical protein